LKQSAYMLFYQKKEGGGGSASVTVEKELLRRGVREGGGRRRDRRSFMKKYLSCFAGERRISARISPRVDEKDETERRREEEGEVLTSIKVTKEKGKRMGRSKSAGEGKVVFAPKIVIEEEEAFWAVKEQEESGATVGKRRAKREYGRRKSERINGGKDSPGGGLG